MKIYFNLDQFNKDEKKLIKLIVNQPTNFCFCSHQTSFKRECIKHEKIRKMSKNKNINLDRKFNLVICDKFNNYHKLFTNFFRLYISCNLKAVKCVIYSLLTDNILKNNNEFDEDNEFFYCSSLGQYDEWCIDILRKGLVTQEYINTCHLDREIIAFLSIK